MTGALHVLQLRLSPPPHSSLAPIKPANPGSPGKITAKMERGRERNLFSPILLQAGPGPPEISKIWNLWEFFKWDVLQPGCRSCNPTNSVKALKGQMQLV